MLSRRRLHFFPGGDGRESQPLHPGATAPAGTLSSPAWAWRWKATDSRANNKRAMVTVAGSAMEFFSLLYGFRESLSSVSAVLRAQRKKMIAIYGACAPALEHCKYRFIATKNDRSGNVN